MTLREFGRISTPGRDVVVSGDAALGQVILAIEVYGAPPVSVVALLDVPDVAQLAELLTAWVGSDESW